MLGELLSVVNIEKHTDQIRSVNAIISRLNKHSENFVMLKPLKGQLEVEVFGDSSFRDNNQQGIALAIRQAGTNICNLVEWKSQKSDRRAGSTLAAETHVMQNALDKAIGIKTFLYQIGVVPKSSKVLTDNLSLKRVIYSGRRLKR